jgi:hypothetical protein
LAVPFNTNNEWEQNTMKYVALVLGIALLALGIASFVPAAVVDGLLFGFLPISVEMSLALIGVGALGIMAGVSQPRELALPKPTGPDLREWVA